MDNHPPKIMHDDPASSDLISSLPDSVIESILSLLPLREAAATSLLSSAWRNQWRCISKLVFDNGLCDLDTPELMLTIISILLLHRGPITSLKFRIDVLRNCPELEQLMLFLCGKPVQEFIFRFETTQMYQLPPHLLSYEHLQFLSLSSCVVSKPPQTFRGFHKLIHLKFYQVRFECDVHRCFISQCPLLEHLTLFYCSGIDTFVIGFSNLKTLKINGTDVKSFRFQICPLLATIVIRPRIERDHVDEEVESCSLVRFFDCLPVIESIELGFEFLSDLTNEVHLKRFPNDIHSLRVLKFFDIYFEDMKEVSWVLRLIMSAPNLEKITIKVHPDGESDYELLFKAEDLAEYSWENLRKVEMDGFGGAVTELELVKLLLSKSPALEVLEMRRSPDLDPEDLQVIMEKVNRFSLVSSKAKKITWLEPDENLQIIAV